VMSRLDDQGAAAGNLQERLFPTYVDRFRCRRSIRRGQWR
jgi:hypothetical protein